MLFTRDAIAPGCQWVRGWQGVSESEVGRLAGCQWVRGWQAGRESEAGRLSVSQRLAGCQWVRVMSYVGLMHCPERRESSQDCWKLPYGTLAMVFLWP